MSASQDKVISDKKDENTYLKLTTENKIRKIRFQRPIVPYVLGLAYLQSWRIFFLNID